MCGNQYRWQNEGFWKGGQEITRASSRVDSWDWDKRVAVITGNDEMEVFMEYLTMEEYQTRVEIKLW